MLIDIYPTGGELFMLTTGGDKIGFLFVYITTVANFYNKDAQNPVLYLANYPMLTYSVTPEIAKRAGQCLT